MQQVPIKNLLVWCQFDSVGALKCLATVTAIHTVEPLDILEPMARIFGHFLL